MDTEDVGIELEEFRGGRGFKVFVEVESTARGTHIAGISFGLCQLKCMLGEERCCLC